MGNFHCIPSSCAEVVYSEYLPPVVRWRYPGEDWQEIEADDYQIDNDSPQFEYLERKRYSISAKAIVAEQVPPESSNLPAVFEKGQIITVFITGGWDAPIWDIQLKINGKNVHVDLTYTPARHGNAFAGYCEKKTSERTLFVRHPRNGSVQIKKDPGSYVNPTIDLNIGLFDYEFIEAGEAKACLNPIPKQCIFKALLKGELVHEETHEDCPEVEQLPCRLSDVSKSIKIDKEAYIQRIEVRNQSIDVIILPNSTLPLIFTSPLPEECLNIYNTYTLAPPFPNENIPAPGVFNPYNFIQQICSAPGCPAPKYEVICNCQCESCPDGTCGVECGDHICCYDSTTGQAVKEIAIAQYCGGQN